MEVTPEMYAWLTSLNVINPFQCLEEDTMENFIIPESTVNTLLGGKYFDIILKNLQEAYNKFYKVKMDFISRIKEIKAIDEGQDYVSNSIKYANWHLISELLRPFGLMYTDEEVTKLIDGDKEFLLKVITQIYELVTQFLKHCENEKEAQKDKDTQSVKSSSNKLDKNSKSKQNLSNTKRSNLKLTTIPESQNEDKHMLTTNNNNYLSTHLNKTKSINKDGIIAYNNLTQSNISNNNNNNNQIAPRIKDQSININELEENKTYDYSTSALEFFILTLCKNMNMKPRQVVAILSNNRKYLTIICNKGINGEFTMIKNWLDDLKSNFNTMLKLIKTSEDGMNISYGTIGTAICSKDPDIPLQCIQLLHEISGEVGVNWDWLKKEGIDSFLFTITKHDKNRFEVMNLLYEFIRNNIPEFFNVLRTKCLTNDRNKVYEFLSSILPLVKDLASVFMTEIQEFLFDLCLNEKEDMSYSSSILADAFYYFYPIEETIADKTIDYFKRCIRSISLNIFGTSVAQIFNLLVRFGKTKNKYGPPLYKALVFLFLELYDNEYKREYILENFEKFFNSETQVPIDILLEPYLNQLNSVQNYNLCDIIFLFKIVEHPRIESRDICQIIQFILTVSMNNLLLSRSANLVLCLIFEKHLIQRLCTPNDTKEITYKFIEYIHTILDLFISNLSNVEDKAILETPYDILGENFPNVNNQVHNKIVQSVFDYRKITKKNSTGLLAMLWYFPDHDDVIMQVEEENRPIYEPMEQVILKKQKEYEIKESKNFTKKTQNYINELQEKRNNKVENKELKMQQKKQKEEKIKKNLAMRRKMTSVMSGVEPVQKPPLLVDSLETQISQVKSTKNLNITQKKSIKKKEIETGQINSNMLQAFSNASKAYKNKEFVEASYNHVNTEVMSYNSESKDHLSSRGTKRLKLSLEGQIELPRIGKYKEQGRDDIMEKYGNIMSIEKKRLFEEAQNEYKLLQKLQISNTLIQPEGKYIKINPGGTQAIAEMSIKVRKAYKTSEIYKNFNLPINLEEEENRELKAINGYNSEYKKNIRFYFKSYANEVTQTIGKSKLIRLFRDKGINKDKLDLEEVNIIIRNLFGENLNELDFTQFANLLVQISFLLYSKRRPTLTIGETYGILLRRFKIANISESTLELKRKMEPVIDLLLEKKENKEPFNLPEGFKFVKKTNVKYNSRLAPHFKNILGESKFICYQVLEEIIFNVFTSSIIEPYVEVNIKEEVEIEPEKIHKWSPRVHMAYIEMGEEYKKIGIEACDALEDGFKSLNKGRNSKGQLIMSIRDKKILEEEKKALKKENRRDVLLNQRKIQIQDKVKQYKEEKKKKRKEKFAKYKKLRQKRLEAMEKIHKKFEEVEKRRKQKEEEQRAKYLEKKNKDEQKREKKIQKSREYLKRKKRILREQFRVLYNTRIEIEYEKEQIKKKKEKVFVKKAEKNPAYLKDNKEYIEFEKELNNNIKKLKEEEDIKAVFDKYKEHLELIYTIYSKIGCNKISLYTKECITIDEFKQFLINFTILGLLVSSDQMLWIYKTISQVKQKEREDQTYFDYDDFEVSLCYLAIFSRFADRDRKIMPSDIEKCNFNGDVVDNFLGYLGLVFPFNKYETEQYINDRRSMTVKDLIALRQELQKNKVGEFKKEEMAKVEEQKKERRKKEEERRKKEREKEKAEAKKNDKSNKSSPDKKSYGRTSRSVDIKKRNKNTSKSKQRTLSRNKNTISNNKNTINSKTSNNNNNSGDKSNTINSNSAADKKSVKSSKQVKSDAVSKKSKK